MITNNNDVKLRINLLKTIIVLGLFTFYFLQNSIIFENSIKLISVDHFTYYPFMFFDKSRVGFYFFDLFFIYLGFALSDEINNSYLHLKKKIKIYYIPYLIILSFWFLVFNHLPNVNINDYLSHFFLLHIQNLDTAFNINSSYWIFPYIFIIYCLFYIFHKIKNTKKFSILLLAVILISCVLKLTEIPYNLSFFYNNLITCTTFVFIGNLIYNFYKNLNFFFLKYNSIILILFLCLFVLIFKLNIHYQTFEFFSEIFFISFLFVIILFAQIKLKFKFGIFINKFSSIGFVFFLIHEPLIFHLKKFFSSISGISLIQNWLQFLLVLIVILLISLSLQRFLNRLTNFLIKKLNYSNLYILTINLSLILIVTISIILFTKNSNFTRQKFDKFPLVHRYNKSIEKSGFTNGDLSTMYHKKIPSSCFRNTNISVDKFGFVNPKLNFLLKQSIIVLGDSYSSSAPSYSDCWPNLLRNKTKKNVYNLAQPGESPNQEFIQFSLENKRILKDTNCIILWQLFSGNDLDDVFFGLNIDSLNSTLLLDKVIAKSTNLYSSSIFGFITDKIKTRINIDYEPDKVVVKTDTYGKKMYFLKSYIEHASRSEKDIITHPNFKNIKKLIACMKRKYGYKYKIIIMPLPSKEEVYHWMLNKNDSAKILKNKFKFSKIVSKLCLKHNIACINPSDYLYKMALFYSQKGKYLWLNDDTHMNKLGNNILVDFILNMELIDK